MTIHTSLQKLYPGYKIFREPNNDFKNLFPVMAAVEADWLICHTCMQGSADKQNT